MPNRKTRDRQLAKLHARRAAERRKKQRQRTLTLVISGVLVLGLIIGLFIALTGGGKPAAKPTPSNQPTTPASPTVAPVACGGTVPAAASQTKPTFTKPPAMTIDLKKTYTATIKTSCGTIVIKLDPKQSPNAVNSFVYLAKQKFFDGLIFHRTSKDFVIQGGDPQGTGAGGPGYQTVDTPPTGTTYPVGVVAMAKAGSDPAGSAGSQFFIVTGSNASSLPADYAIIGTVTSGQDIAKQIESLPINPANSATDGKPIDTVYIESIKITTS